eukprot:2270101-Prymnesium_polylepis.1
MLDLDARLRLPDLPLLLDDHLTQQPADLRDRPVGLRKHLTALKASRPTDLGETKEKGDVLSTPTPRSLLQVQLGNPCISAPRNATKITRQTALAVRTCSVERARTRHAAPHADHTSAIWLAVGRVER